MLLNLKHIYLYCAPVYFFYLLKHYCLSAADNYRGGVIYDVKGSEHVLF